MKTLLGSVFALAAVTAAACSSTSTNTSVSPTEPPATATADAGDDDGLAPGYAFPELHALAFGGTGHTEGVIVMHQGKRVFEEYAAGFTATMPHIAYSVSKSFGSALVGIAIGEGLMKLDDSVCVHVPAPAGADPKFCDTTIDHLLRMSSGIGWAENYEGDDPTSSNVLQMLYGNQADMGGYVATLPRTAKAGERWRYSSGDSNLLARALRGALKGKDMRAWANEKLFVPAKLTSAVFESDRSGTLVFSSSCFLTPRDMARFGQLYLDDGTSGATRVLPPNWVSYTRTPAPATAQPKPRDPTQPAGDTGGSYGGSFWLNATSDTAPADTWAYPEATADTYSAEGHYGQKIIIVPSRRLVVVRVGNDRDKPFAPGPMLKHVLSVIDAKGVK